MRKDFKVVLGFVVILVSLAIMAFGAWLPYRFDYYALDNLLAVIGISACGVTLFVLGGFFIYLSNKKLIHPKTR